MPVAAARKLLKCLVCLAAAWGTSSLAGPNSDSTSAAVDASGVPMLSRFNAEHYSVMPQHSSIVTDANGRVFVGNVEGVLLYSAGRFEHLHPAQEMSVRSLALSDDGGVLVGAYDQFGCFREQPDGEWTYTDLDEQFRDVPDAHPLGRIWLVANLPDGQYFLAERRLFRIGSNGEKQSWPIPSNVLNGVLVGNEIWARVVDQGLMRFDGKAFVSVPGGEEFIVFGVQSAAPHPEGTLFTSRAKGLYLGDAKHGLRHIDTAYDAWMLQTQVYSVAALADGNYALATLSGEVAIIDASLALKKQYRISNFPITDIAASVDGGLWFATEGDLVRMEWPSPWAFVGEEDGLFGALNDAEWFEGKRWVATSLGLFRSDRDDDGRVRFHALPWARDEVWDLQRIGDDLLVGERKSVQVVHAGEATRLIDSDGVFELIPSTFVPGRVLALEDASILELDHTASWRVSVRHDLGEVAISTLVELATDRWLIGNWRGYPQLVTRTSGVDGPHIVVQPLGPEYGLPEQADAGSSVWKTGGKTFATIGDDLYEWRGNHFVAQPDHPLVKLAGTRLNEIEFRGGEKHQYAFTSRDIWIEQDGQWQSLNLESRRALGMTELSLADDGRLTVVAWGGLLTYDPRLIDHQDATFHLRMHRVWLTDSGRQTRLLDRRGQVMLELPPLEGLRFEYGIDGHDSAVEYRNQLEGNDGSVEWSEWSTAQVREFNRLAPGDYHLRVQARTRAGHIPSNTLDFPFHVQPRWYQTRATAWAVAALVLLVGSLLAWSWGRFRSRQLHDRNLELEREVAAHTRDLEIANQRLSRLAVQDGLTGITNRRGFEQFYQRTWNRLAEQRQTLALLMVDVDFFKQYNDQHGHLLGDEVLRGIARQLEHEVHEPVEMLARFGGEEFVIVLPGIDIEDATTRAHAVRLRCEIFGKDRDVTVSVGVAACVPRGGLKSAQLLDEADAALYRAKKLGRNRIERGRQI
ncbi:MAG: diguanylate cyclase [Rhodanobacteraceae bacterium]|nr:diguanylate cyclase [Rhodanobacteraceae bacterium]